MDTDASEVDFRSVNDSDSDGIADGVDIDDDNDGILDINEGDYGPGSAFGQDLLIANFDGGLAAVNGGYLVWGQEASATATDLQSPQLISVANGYNFTGDILGAATGGTTTSAQYFLLTSENLYAWGVETAVVNGGLTVGTGFQPIFEDPGQGTGLADLPVAAADIDRIVATSGALVLTTSTGEVWVNGVGAELYGDGDTGADALWHNVLDGAGGTPIQVEQLAIFEDNAFAYTTAGNYITWGADTRVGDGSAEANITFPAIMTPPPVTAGVPLQLGLTGTTATTSYFVLGEDGRVYSMGENANGQLGIGSTTDQATWQTVLAPAASGDTFLENVSFLSTQSGSNSAATVSVIQNDGTLLGWGSDVSDIQGLPGGNTVSLPIAPNFTGTPVAAQYVVNGGDFTMFVGTDGNLYSVGDDAEGGLANGANGAATTYIVANAITPPVALTAALNSDADGDGIRNSLDLDSDNDGISDMVESGASAAVLANDIDGNGTIALGENSIVDADSDGLMDIYDANTTDPSTAASVGTRTVDTDSEGIADFIDLDSDNDGIVDTVEADATTAFEDPGVQTSWVDADSDGVLAIFDNDEASYGAGAGGFNTPVDTDSDGTADYQDTDSDNDTLPDASEAGIGIRIGADADFDGLDDGIDSDSTAFGGTGGDPSNGIDVASGTTLLPGDTVGTDNAVLDNTDTDATDLDFRSVDDKDGDGIVDQIDIDDDNDGILDINEGFIPVLGPPSSPGFADEVIFYTDPPEVSGAYDDPTEALGPSDSNGTTTGFVSLGNAGELIVGYNGEFMTNSGDSQADLRIIEVNVIEDAAVALLPDAATKLLLDSQGLITPDVDGFYEVGLINAASADIDIDAATANAFYGGELAFTQVKVTAINGAGTGTVGPDIDSIEALFTSLIRDSDSDGLSDHCDLDSDHDGISDIVESGNAAYIAADTNNDGTVSAAEALAVQDVDSDGLADDFDSDGLWDLLDANDSDATAAASVGSDPVDSDSDGANDYIDLDSDNDGIVDTVEADPSANFEDPGAQASWVDADSDGVLAVFDNDEANFGAGNNGFNTPEDTDSDGIADYLDTDSDNDSLSDASEAGLGTLTGVDADSDGLDDGIDTDDTAFGGTGGDPSNGINAASGTTLLPGDTVGTDNAVLDNTDDDATELDFRSIEDKDSDGIADPRDIDDDNDGILDINEGDFGPTGFGQDLLMLNYDGGLASTANGYLVWGQEARPSGANGDDLSTPQEISVANGYNFTGDILNATTAGTTTSAQYFLLTTDGLYAWGVESAVVNGGLTTGTGFQAIFEDPAQGTGLADLPVNATEIDRLIASSGSLVLTTTSGEVWVNGVSAQIYGDNDTTADALWHNVQNPDNTAPLVVEQIALYEDNAFAYTADGQYVTWGNDTHLGDGTGEIDRNLPTVMVPPPAAAGTPVQLGMTGTTATSSYYVLGEDGKIYSLGENGNGQLGIGSITDQNTWQTVQNPAGTADLADVAYIATQYGSDSIASVSAIQTDGTLLSWGSNAGDVLGLPVAGNTTLPTAPDLTGVGSPTAMYVANGGDMTAFVGSDGLLYTVGDNAEDGLGNGGTGNQDTYVAVTPIMQLTAALMGDSDGDGIPDHCDLDSDNDGISDLVEGGNAAAIAMDLDGNGTLNLGEGGAVDIDSDGLLDVFDADTGNTSAVASMGTSLDTDNDGVIDARDLDSDADGIADAIEAQLTVGYASPYPSAGDVDSDGVIDGAPGTGFDSTSTFGGSFSTPVDTDSDGVADYLDTDSDNDTLADRTESGLSTFSNADANFDGIFDDADIGASYADPDGVVNDPINDLRNVDSDPTDADYRSVQDKDGDGIADHIDIDDDNDGILDVDESPLEVYTFDNIVTDNTSIPRTLSFDVLDSNGVKVADAQISSADIRDFAASQIRNDASGPALTEPGNTVNFRSVATTTSEQTFTFSITPLAGQSVPGGQLMTNGRSDGLVIGGIEANLSGMSFNGTGLTSIELLTDTVSGRDYFNNDTTDPGDFLTPGAFYDQTGETDNVIFAMPIFEVLYSFDEIASGQTITATYTHFNAVSPTNEIYDWVLLVSAPRDTDGDGIADQCDLDSDNDGISDIVESGNAAYIAADTNRDGTVSAVEALAVQDVNSDGMADDFDSDGLWDLLDANDGDATAAASVGSDPLDSDSDGVDDFIDLDSDNDLTPDAIEGQPTTGYIPFASGDADSDGIVDVWDGDTPGHGSNGANALPTFSDPVDTDSDSIADYLDDDSDSDGILDINENGLTSATGTDADSDGIADDIQVTSSGAALAAGYSDPDGILATPLTQLENADSDATDVDFRSVEPPEDKDSDGIIDSIDIDDDNDGILDVDEGLSTTAVVIQDSFNGIVDDTTAPTGWVVENSSPDITDINTPTTFIESGDPVNGWGTTPVVTPVASSTDGGTWVSASTFILSGNTQGETISTTWTGLAANSTHTISWEQTNYGAISGGLTLDEPALWRFEIFEDAGGGTAGALVATVEGDLMPSTNAWTTTSGTFTTTSGTDYVVYLSSHLQVPSNSAAGYASIDGIQVLGPSATDTDSDGIFDHCDLDSDNDGISDLVESGDAAGIALDVDSNGTLSLAEGAVDSDSDGLMDVFEDGNLTLNTGTIAADSDSDAFADYIDIDSDNDGIVDIVEQQSTSGYIDIDPATANTDADSDGIVAQFDADDGAFGGLNNVQEDTDSDGAADYTDSDADSDGIPDSVEGDVVVDGDSGDADSDGLLDQYDRTNTAAVNTFDSSNGITTSGAGAVNTYTEDTDSDGDPDFRDTDADNDGIPDSVEGDTSGGPDVDSDGTPDFRDTDVDNDGIPDSIEGATTGGPDTDNDGTPDYQDTDTDNDGIPDSVEGATTGEPDTDSDGTPDYRDTDADNDGIPDSVEGATTGGPDSDSDGTPDFRESDADSDGIPDSVEGNTTGGPDSDSDGTPDFRDTDTDNDGIPDSVEGNTTGSPDTDSDGTPDFRDTDSDNDGIPDSTEGNTTGGPDTDSDGTPDYRDVLVDKDSDGIDDLVDIDDDNDGILDTVESNIVDFLVNDGVDGTFNTLNGSASSTTSGVQVTGAGWSNFTGSADVWITPDSVGASWDGGANNGLQDSPDGGAFASAVPQFPGGGLGEGFRHPFSASAGIQIGDDITIGFYQANGGVEGSAPPGSEAQWQVVLDGQVQLSPLMTYQGPGNQTWSYVELTFTNMSTTTPTLSFRGADPQAIGNIVSQYEYVSVDGVTAIIAGSASGTDTDGDGIVDACDLDSDNDGISDLVESGDTAGINLDADSNGTISLSEGADSDSDGLLDVFEDGNLASNTGTIPQDGDSDGIANYIDIDSDNDGIVDLLEQQTTSGFVDVADAGTGNTDDDSDGVLAQFDTTDNSFGGTFSDP